MKLTKKSGGVVAAVVMAGGLTAASATSAFAAAPAHSPKTTPVAKGSDEAKKDTAKTHKGRHHRMGMHGERTVKGKDGKSVVHEWQRGTVTAVSGNTITVKSPDGFTLTWTVGSTTKVHAGAAGAKAKAGDKVLVEGVKSGSVNQANVIHDHSAKHAAKASDKDEDKQGKQDGDDQKAPTVGKHRKPGAPAPTTHPAPVTHNTSHEGSASAHDA